MALPGDTELRSPEDAVALATLLDEIDLEEFSES
jgi:hypothetical protein